MLFQKVIYGNIVNKVINRKIVNMLLKIIKHPIYNTVYKIIIAFISILFYDNFIAKEIFLFLEEGKCYI